MGEKRAAQRWRQLVEGRRQQMDRAYGALQRTSADFWAQRAARFRRYAGIADDENPLIRRVLALLPPGGSVIDVGAGTGSYALALARHTSRLVAVEPSEAMAAILREDAEANGLDTITLVEDGWLESAEQLEPADIVLCANTLYPHAEIERWLHSLEAKATVAVVLQMVVDFSEPDVLLDLWQQFHGSRRILQPGYMDVYAVLHELGIPANVEIYPGRTSRFFRFESLDHAVEGAREHLLLPITAEVDATLRAALVGALRDVGGALELPLDRAAATIWWTCDGPRMRSNRG